MQGLLGRSGNRTLECRGVTGSQMPIDTEQADGAVSVGANGSSSVANREQQLGFGPEVPSLQERTTIDFSDPDALVGQTLEGRFYIEKNLKENGGDAGGIGVVYLARDTKLLGKDVVVKILNEEALRHPDIIRKFDHEKEALVRLDHPCIVRILDSGKLLDGNPFMVMEHVKGHSLRRALQLAGRLPLNVVASITEQVTDALSAAHEAKILHRDIKPENIMLTPVEEGRYRVRLIDFGIAKVQESQLAPETQISRAIGSIHYISPEQLIGRFDLTPAADIFSFGIVIYEMLTGEVPFKPQTFPEMYKLEAEGIKTPPSAIRTDLPRGAERSLLSALEFEATRRPQIARPFGRLLAHELRIGDDETDRYYASIKTEFYTSPTISLPSETLTPEVETVLSKENDRLARSFRYLKWAVASAALLAVLVVTGAYFASQRTPAAAVEAPITVPTSVLPERNLTFYLMVQKVRGKSVVGKPFKSSGQVGVETGYLFAANVKADEEGYLYAFNYGKNEAGVEEFSIHFPTPDQRPQGSARVGAGELIQATQSEMDGQRGDETLWIIWTKDKNEFLNELVRKAFDNDGDLKGLDTNSLRSFLEKERPTSEAVRDAESQQTFIRGRGDEIVQRFYLEHR